MFKKRSDIFDSNFVYFLILSIFIVIRIISSTFAISTVWGYVLNATIQIVLMFCLPMFFYSYLRKQKIKQTIKQYGFNKINVKAIMLSLVIGILVYFITIFIATFFSAILNLLGYEKSSGSTMTSYPIWLFILELIFTAVLPGICEEVANRGMMLSSYKKMGAKKAILLSGLLFGLMHLNIEQFFYASIIGFFFGFVALITDSIYPTMIMHFTNNAMSTIMGFSIFHNLPLGTAINNFLTSITSNNPFVSILLIFALISIIIFLLIFLTLQLFKQTRVNQLTQMANEIMKNQLRKEIMGNLVEEENQEQNPNVEFNQQNIGSKKIFNVNFKNSILITNNLYKPTFKENIFLYVNLFMAITITIFTFLWGVL